MVSDIEERLRAVERALTDADTVPADLEDAATLNAAVEEQTERIDRLSERVEELEAAVQALRGYVGSVRAVNREVERRADAALAAVEDDLPETDGDGDLEEWL